MKRTARPTHQDNADITQQPLGPREPLLLTDGQKASEGNWINPCSASHQCQIADNTGIASKSAKLQAANHYENDENK